LQALDNLDGILISVTHESPLDAEDALRRAWRETFAHYATAEEGRLEEIFTRRGVAVETQIYADADQRRRIYRTTLPPRGATAVMTAAPDVLAHLRTGGEYAQWPTSRRFEFVEQTVELVSTVEGFSIPANVGQTQATWRDALRWWLDRDAAVVTPTARQVAQWHDFLSQQLRYRFAWGLGAVLAAAVEQSPTVSEEAWQAAEVPWAAIWLKDILTWGTLDPVAAYLLARRVADTRNDAERLASAYYDDAEAGSDPLDPSLVRAWASPMVRRVDSRSSSARHTFEVQPVREVQEGDFLNRRWRVIPVRMDNGTAWCDPSGAILAESPNYEAVTDDLARAMDFFLTPAESLVTTAPYL
jgi:hypothetical protein